MSPTTLGQAREITFSNAALTPLGLTTIHVNRACASFAKQLLTLRGGTVKLDLPGLRKLVGFQGGYLYARD